MVYCFSVFSSKVEKKAKRLQISERFVLPDFFFSRRLRRFFCLVEFIRVVGFQVGHLVDYLGISYRMSLVIKAGPFVQKPYENDLRLFWADNPFFSGLDDKTGLRTFDFSISAAQDGLQSAAAFLREIPSQ